MRLSKLQSVLVVVVCAAAGCEYQPAPKITPAPVSAPKPAMAAPLAEALFTVTKDGKPVAELAVDAAGHVHVITSTDADIGRHVAELEAANEVRIPVNAPEGHSPREHFEKIVTRGDAAYRETLLKMLPYEFPLYEVAPKALSAQR